MKLTLRTTAATLVAIGSGWLLSLGLLAPLVSDSAGATVAGSPSSSVAYADSTCTGVLVARTDGSVSGLAPNGDMCAAGIVSGSLAGTHLNAPIVGVTALPNGNGYWLLASDGGVFTYGQAQFYGSTGSMHLNAPVVGMAATPSGHGYWLVASDGGIFSYGDAQFYGSTGNIHLNKPIVGMAADQATGGYWLVAADGGVFAYNAPFLGSMGGKPLNAPMRFMTGTPDYGGYRLVAADGGVFGYGDAAFYGSAAAPGSSGWSALATTPDNAGYWLFAQGGSAANPIYDAFGNAASVLTRVSGDSASSAFVVGAATVTFALPPTPPPGTVTPSPAGGHLTGVTCTTAQICVAAGTTQAGGALLERSTDGGASFAADAVPTAAPAMASVSCPTTTTCVAVGTTNAMVSTDGGVTWTLESTPATTGLTGVSCENTLDCAAVGATAGHSTWIYSTDGARTWTLSPGPGGFGTGIKCLASSCIAVGDSIYRSTDGGANWTLIGATGGSITELFSISCGPGGTTCAAIGPNPSGISNPTDPGELALSTDSGSSFTVASANLPASTATLQQISCGDASDCLAIGPPPSTGALVGSSTSNAGSSWTPYSGPSGQTYANSGLTQPLLGIWCSSASACVLVGGDSSAADAFTTTNAGQNWNPSTVQ